MQIWDGRRRVYEFDWDRVSCMSCDNDGVIVDGSGLNGMYGVLMWI